jgi:hypothetical protein
MGHIHGRVPGMGRSLDEIVDKLIELLKAKGGLK